MSPYVTTPPSADLVPVQHRAWWKEVSVYQIYPSSFKDTNDDGIGDLEGIISKVDYMKKLGVDCVWLSPILKSPQVDMGYDVADYRVIDARYGTLEHVDRLIKELKSRDMKLLMDLVVNHTSDQHEWFLKSRSSKQNEYRDWYVWRPAKYDAEGVRHPPNNWQAAFQGSVWEWDELTQEYYLHIFAVEQPDLNWENPQVRAAVHDIMRFWLDRGADGFRMDVINFISKEPGLPDAPITNPDSPWQSGEHFYSAGPRLHEYLAGLGSILKEYNAFSVGEMPCVSDPKEVIKSVGYDRGELNMIFQFDHVDIDYAPGPDGRFTLQSPKWSLSKLRVIFETMQKFMYANDGWNALYLENHDQPRSVNRFACGCPQHRASSAKMLATFLCCQAGTPFIFQGQELGMTNVPKEWGIEEYKDLCTLNHWAELNKRTQDPEILKAKLVEYQKKARDNARTPMQWDDSPNAGFTCPSTEPWMRANDNYTSVNAASQIDDPHSPFSYWAKMLATRKEYKDLFVYGDFDVVDATSEDIFAYTRRSENGEKMLVICNFSPEKVQWNGEFSVPKKILMSTHERDLNGAAQGLVLKEYEALAILL
ncbi:trehalose-6-phosphate hydrolase [Phlyctema vagabunda]|uniref:Trehalose-6-phosphate hydrolase n=1 Tax=Phlyctema vagabunda TaxID=108571 RepID=A0ABR4PI44_9HELO